MFLSLGKLDLLQIATDDIFTLLLIPVLKYYKFSNSYCAKSKENDKQVSKNISVHNLLTPVYLTL